MTQKEKKSLPPLYNSDIKGLPLLARGKVRDLYSIDEKHILIVATDRLSAFDVVLPDPIPNKGIVLTTVSNFWFQFLAENVSNHISGLTMDEVVPKQNDLANIKPRSMVAKRFDVLPIEAVVRGYLIGSGWREYQKSGKVCGQVLPVGLQQAAKLPEAIFTPSTKAQEGEHDQNISFDEVVELIGENHANQLRKISLKLYQRAAQYTYQKGIIIADTKFEFGVDGESNLVLVDEVLTPDSSRFWPVSSYQVGRSPESFDKQYVRDYLETLDWDMSPPGPPLPPEVVQETALKYQALQRILLTD